MEDNKEVFDLGKALKQVLKVKKKKKVVKTKGVKYTVNLKNLLRDEAKPPTPASQIEHTTVTHTSVDGTVVRVEGKDTTEAMSKLLQQRGITTSEEFNKVDLLKLNPPIVEATWT